MLFSLSSISNLASAASIKNGNLSGNVTNIIELDENETKKAKENFNTNLNEALVQELPVRLKNAENKGNNKEAKEIKKLMKSLKDKKSKTIFTDKKMGSNINTPLPDLTVKLGEFETVTDENGDFKFHNIPVGKYNLIIKFKENIITSDFLDIRKGENHFEIEINLSGEAFFEGSQIMSETNMVNSEIGEATTTYYSTKAIGSYVGEGKGRMKIIASNNIVGCNKAAKKIADSAKFPFNSSDCSIAIERGAAYASNKTLFFYWSENYVCYIESIQSALSYMGDKSTNVYCNAKKKNGGHYNCSWFRDHSERLHTH